MAQSTYAATATQTDTVQHDLLASQAAYQQSVAQAIPVSLATMHDWRAQLNPSVANDPRVRPLLDEIAAALHSPDPQVLAAVLQKIEDDHDLQILLLPLRYAVLRGDPRLAVADGRALYASEQARSGWSKALQDITVNTFLLGLPAYLEHRSIRDAPGANFDTQVQANVGLTWDYLGFAMLLAGPLAKMGGKVAGLTEEALVGLRAAGYTDEAIAALTARVAQVGDAQRIIYTGTADDFVQHTDELRSSRVYRVQGGTPPLASRTRVTIGNNGEMQVVGSDVLFVTFDDFCLHMLFSTIPVTFLRRSAKK